MQNAAIHNVTIHEAKSNLSKLLVEVETHHQTIRVYRNKTPIAEIVPISQTIDPLISHAELQGIQLNYDPTEPLTPDEWPIDTAEAA